MPKKEKTENSAISSFLTHNKNKIMIIAIICMQYNAKEDHCYANNCTQQTFYLIKKYRLPKKKEKVFR